MRVMLWDIDGTLLNTDSAGKYAWIEALEELARGPVDTSAFRPAGATDPSLAIETIEGCMGVPFTEALGARLLDRYLELLPEWLGRRTNGFAHPNVETILEASADLPDIETCLLTGNLESGGRMKLAHYGLWDHFRWGAFADGLVERRDIARRALHRAHEYYGRDIELVVIGDTPRDIDCGKAIAATTVAVATGPYDTEELAEHDPDLVLESLPRADEFFRALDARSAAR